MIAHKRRFSHQNCGEPGHLSYACTAPRQSGGGGGGGGSRSCYVSISWVENKVAFADIFLIFIIELQPRRSYQQRLPTKGILDSDLTLINSKLRHAALILRRRKQSVPTSVV